MLNWNQLLAWRAETDPDSLALVDDLGASLTYGELAARVDGLAGAWSERGVVAGDVVGILAHNSADWMAHLFALTDLGAVPAAINHRVAPQELAGLIHLAGPRGVLVDEPGAALIAAAGVDLPVTVTTAEAAQPSFARPRTDPTHVQVSPHDPAVLLHTSGTTGNLPKFVPVSHQRLMSSAMYLKLTVPEARPGSRHLRAMPLFHLAGLANVTYPLFIGGTAYVHSSFRPAAFLDALVEHRIEFTNLVPTAIAMLIDEVRSRPTSPDLSALVEIGYGASPISPSLLREAIEILGCRFRQNYGCTETGGFPVSTLDPADHTPDSPRLHTAGKPALGWHVRIVDPQLRDVPPGTPGEILVRGSLPFDGYWNNPEATAEALTPDGYWRIGDIGVLDEDGYLSLVDRAKDMVISGGENVYPAEIERVLSEHPAIAEIAVIGIPDDRWGETLHAVVVTRPGQVLDEAELLAWSRERLAGFKCPRSVEVVPELPRNATGKVLKRVLRERHWQGQERAVS